MAYPCPNSILVLWVVDRDRQDTIGNVIDRPLPVPRGDRRSEDKRWRDTAV